VSNVANLYLNETDIESALEKSEAALANMQALDLVTPAQLRNEILDFFALNGDQKGDPLPWEKSEKLIKLRPGELSIWGGVNGEGKSLMLGQVIGWQLAKHRALVASFEMQPYQTVGRMIQQLAGCVPSPEFMDRIIVELQSRLYIFNQVKSVKPSKVMALIHYGATQRGVMHFVVDSLTKCGFGYDDYTGQTKFVDELQCVAKSLNVHVHLVCHMTKPQGGVKVGNKFGIRGAGAITDLADNVFIVSRNKEKEAVTRVMEQCGEMDLSEKEREILKQADAYLNVDKNREGGEEGKIGLCFHKQSMQYTSQENRAMPAPMRF